jgi:hypothetical protein
MATTQGNNNSSNDKYLLQFLNLAAKAKNKIATNFAL